MLLPFNGQPLIGRVVAALRLGGAGPVLVVTPPAEAPEGPPIAEAARQAGAMSSLPRSGPPRCASRPRSPSNSSAATARPAGSP